MAAADDGGVEAPDLEHEEDDQEDGGDEGYEGVADGVWVEGKRLCLCSRGEANGVVLIG